MYLIVASIALVVGSITAGPAQWHNSEEDVSWPEYDDFELSMEERCIIMMLDSIAGCCTPWHMGDRQSNNNERSEVTTPEELEKLGLDWLLRFKQAFKQAKKEISEESEYEESEESEESGSEESESEESESEESESEESESEESESEESESEESESEESGSEESDEYEWIYSGEMGSHNNRRFCYARTMLQGMECLAYHAGSNVDHVNPYQSYDLKKMLNIKKEMFARRGESANKIMKTKK